MGWLTTHLYDSFNRYLLGHCYGPGPILGPGDRAAMERIVSGTVTGNRAGTAKGTACILCYLYYRLPHSGFREIKWELCKVSRTSWDLLGGQQVVVNTTNRTSNGGDCSHHFHRETGPYLKQSNWPWEWPNQPSGRAGVTAGGPGACLPPPGPVQLTSIREMDPVCCV